MADYNKTNTGTMSANQKKREGKQDPDYTGKLDVEGVDYWLSAWIRKSSTGSKFLSISLKKKEPKIVNAVEANEVDTNDMPF